MNILIVDDENINLYILEALLTPLGHNLIKASGGKAALDIISSNEIDLILLDIMMPGINGYEVCKTIMANEKKKDIPVIIISALNDTENRLKGLKLGAADYITKPFKSESLTVIVKTLLDLKEARNDFRIVISTISDIINEKTREFELDQQLTINFITSLAEEREPETSFHVKRTQMYVKELAIHLQHHPKFKDYLNDETIQMIYLAAPLHDLGKIAIPENILLKPGKLTEEEFAIMKKHTVYGSEAIAKSENKVARTSFFKFAREIAATHHEKWDGTGYPLGLKGEEIPIPGRLMALADVYDALVRKRPYKQAFPHELAVKIIKEEKGKHFDPDIADAFLALEKKFQEISNTMSND